MLNEVEEYYDDEFSDHHHDDQHPIIHDSEGEDGSDHHSLFSDDDGSHSDDLDNDDDNDSMSSETDSVASVLVVKEDIKLMNVVRAIVILILLTFSFITAESVFVVATIAQQDNFRRSYDQVATMIIETVHERVRSRLWAAQGLATDLSLTARQAEESWPNVTYEGFAARCASTKHVTSATAIAFTPLVPSKDRVAWEAYVTEQAQAAASNVIILSNNDPQQAQQQQFNNESVAAPPEVVTYYPTHRSLEDGIYRFQDAVAVDDQGPSYRGMLFPMWQTTSAAPAAISTVASDATQTTGLTGGVLFNELSNAIRREALGRMVGGANNDSNGRSTMSDFLFENANGTDFAHYSTPAASIYYPIYGAYYVVQDEGETTTDQQGQQEDEDQEEDEVVVGAVNMELPWDTFLDGVLEAYDEPVHVVVENVCGRMFTYEVQGFDTVTFLGQGDHHDPEVDGYAPTNSSYEDFAALFDDHGKQPYDDDGCNNYRIMVYATEDFKTSYINNKAELYRGLVLLVFLSTVIVFIIYDCLVERRQNRLVTAAVRADTIVQSLFPSTVRARLYEKQSVKKKLKNHNETNNANAPTTEEPHHHVNPWKSVASKELSSGEDGGVQIETPKNRLRDFMAASPADQAAQHMKHDGTSAFAIEPIADFFPNTTVLFADIAGFTAWSSEREPSQVFALLETLYRSMDKAAKRFHVFKVETIGDCYVAATGVPEPQAHHAEIMVKFARTSMLRVNELTKRLESTLGPGTAELAMRFGIHSGPVTAGVLRGKKARFQLFGDTMNVASRMESSGLKNKIHVSGDTASILIAEGHQHWIAPRHDKVTLKGKGAMQTYWILLGNSSGSHVSSASSVSSGDQSSACMADECYTGATEATNFAHTAPLPRVIKKKNMLIEKICKGTELESVLGQTDVTDSTSRMIDWNVDVLLTMLKRVVAQRIVREEREQRQQQQESGNGIDGEQQQHREQSPSSSSGNIPSSSEHATQIGGTTGGGPVLDEICMVIEMPDFKVDLCNEAAQRSVTITNRVRRELRDYVACIASGYRQDNAFHNFEHASHVIMSANKLIKRICAPDTVGTKTDFTTADLNAHTYGIGTDPLTHFAVTFSALIHDVGHTGVPNGRLAVEDPEVAAKYVNKSIAEQRSVDIAWDLLLLPHFDHLRDCIYQNDQDRQRFRRLVVNSVLATDIFDKELKQLRNHRWDLAFHSDANNDKQQQQKDQHQEVAVTKRDVHRKATIVIEHIIQASDVAHTMQHWYIYQKWNGRLFKEMYFAYLSGRSEKDPSQGWYGGELWFFDNYVIPLADKLKECGVFGVSHDEYSNYARQNRREWELKGKDSVEKMKAEAEKEATRLGLLKMEGIQEEGEDTEGGEEEKVEEVVEAQDEETLQDQEVQQQQEEEEEKEASGNASSSNSQSDYSSSFTNSVTTLTAPEDSQDGIAQEGEELVAMEEAAGATTTAAAAAPVPVADAAAAPPAVAASADVSADAAATTATTTTAAVVNGAVTGKNTRMVIAPPGRLGIVIDNSSLNGNDTNVPVVHSVGDDSPMRGKLYAGDLLVSIDGVETKGMSVSALQALLAANAHQTRGFCILRGRGTGTTMANTCGGGPTNAYDDDDDQENTA